MTLPDVMSPYEHLATIRERALRAVNIAREACGVSPLGDWPRGVQRTRGAQSVLVRALRGCGVVEESWLFVVTSTEAQAEALAAAWGSQVERPTSTVEWPAGIAKPGYVRLEGVALVLEDFVLAFDRGQYPDLIEEVS